MIFNNNYDVLIHLQIYTQNNGIDCGIHVMHNLEEIAKVTSSAILKKDIHPLPSL